MCRENLTALNQAVIVEHKEIATGIYKMDLQVPDIGKAAKAGQFVNLYMNNGSNLLPRPISICECNKHGVSLVYAVVGKGTRSLSQLTKGASIQILGPLGNGFPIENKKSILVGGGVGIPPLLELAKVLPGEKEIYLGFNRETYLVDEFKAQGNVYVSTMDGSHGFHGNVIEYMTNREIEAGVIYSCGPKPMLKALQAYADDKAMKGYFSLEERMGCGFGACVGCVCQIREGDSILNKRVCHDGPVFDLRKVVL